MKYNADFINAVALVQEHVNPAAAERVFNALFGGTPEQPSKTLAQLRRELDSLVSGGAAMELIYLANGRVGRPGSLAGGPAVVTWIKEYRNLRCCGLKEAKDVHDFIRDNPCVL